MRFLNLVSELVKGSQMEQLYIVLSVKGEGAAENDQLMTGCSEQQMALYEVCYVTFCAGIL